MMIACPYVCMGTHVWRCLFSSTITWVRKRLSDQGPRRKGSHWEWVTQGHSAWFQLTPPSWVPETLTIPLHMVMTFSKIRISMAVERKGGKGRGREGKGGTNHTGRVTQYQLIFFFKVPRHCWNQRWVIWKKTRPGLKPRCSLKLKFFPFMGYLQYYFYCLYLTVYNTFDRHRHIERITITSKLVYLSAHTVGACQGWSS